VTADESTELDMSDHEHDADGADPADSVRLHHIKAGELSTNTAQTPGMRRSEAISAKSTGAERIWMGESVMHAGSVSSNHHHGDSETGIYIVAGNPVFVFAEDGVERRVETSPGDYVFVPPFLPHREENPTGNEVFVVLSRSSQEAIVVNLDSLTD
jgi:uncharacterized RmlC-like cupin family protein